MESGFRARDPKQACSEVSGLSVRGLTPRKAFLEECVQPWRGRGPRVFLRGGLVSSPRRLGRGGECWPEPCDITPNRQMTGRHPLHFVDLNRELHSPSPSLYTRDPSGVIWLYST